jgi:beta-lactamase regulating signal transducer with metallopeptidase domain
MLGLRRKSAQLRYATACAALVLSMVIPWGTFLRMGTSSHEMALQFSEHRSQPAVGPNAIGSGILGSHAWSLSLTDAIGSILPWLVLFWAIGCAWGTFQLLVEWTSSRQLAGTPIRPLPEALSRRCSELARQLGIRRVVQLSESLLVDVPSIVGWLKPVILVPVGAFSGLTAVQVDGILAHELAHVFRNDHPVRLLQSICSILLFYHPAVHAISDLINLERESACDDLAVALTKDPIALAEALAMLEEARVPRLGLAASGDGHLLFRVRRILGQSPAPDKIRARTAWATICGIGAYSALFLLSPQDQSRAEPGNGGTASFGLYAVATSPANGFKAMTLMGAREESTFYVAENPDLTLEDIARAKAIAGKNDQPILLIKFTSEGRKRFRALTRERSAGGKVAREAIVVDGMLISVPFIRQEIDAPSAEVVSGDPNCRAMFAAFLNALPPEKRD